MDGLVHIHEGSAGSVTAPSNSHLVIESDGHNYISMLNPDGNNSGIYFGEADDNDRASIIVDGGSNDMTFTAGATTQMTIDGDNDRVGIGTTSPSSQLEVTGASARVTVTSTTHGNNSAYKLYAESDNGSSRHGGIYYAAGDTDAASHLSLSADNANYHLSITRDNGYVGIGTTDPDNIFHIDHGAGGYSQLEFDAGGYAGLQFNEGATARGYIDYGQYGSRRGFNFYANGGPDCEINMCTVDPPLA